MLVDVEAIPSDTIGNILHVVRAVEAEAQFIISLGHPLCLVRQIVHVALADEARIIAGEAVEADCI